MKVSVIIQFKNAAPWLPRCLESLDVAEGFLEFLLINDGSTDGSQHLAKYTADGGGRFYYYENEHAPGVSGARNTGLDHAQGDYITFLDADDTLHPEAWWEIKKALKEAPDAQVIQFNHYRQYGPGVSRVVKYWNPEGWRGLLDLPDYWPPVWNKVYKAESLHNLRFIEGLQFGEDELFNLEVFKKARRVYSSELITMVHHFDNPNSLAKSATVEDLKKEVGILRKHRKAATIGDPELYQAITKRLEQLEKMTRYAEVFGT